MYSSIFAILISSASVVAQSSPSVVCIAGQCLQGYSNITIGAKLSSPNAPTTVRLLPGQYSSSTNPQFLHDLLTSSTSSLSSSVGFNASGSPITLPLNLELQPGLAIYAQPLYSGQAGFSGLPSTPVANTSTPLTASSLALSSNVWAAVSSPNNDRFILWNSLPDVSQLPIGSAGSLSLLDLQSSACSPPCSGSGICSASGTCTCPPGFTGASCESCSTGFFGPSCSKCEDGCSKCDDGISGTGRCLVSAVTNAPSACNCANGQCGANGQCACSPGFTTADNGVQCGKCSPGLFLTSTGDCKVCQLGCSQCADQTGTCIACKATFSQDANDRTKCNPPPAVTSDGTVCPTGSFSSGAQCTPCSSSCKTCTGPTSNDCVECATGQFTFNGNCVGTNTDGVCEGSNLIADNNKRECDTCGAKCTTCRIPGFNVASTVNQLQCTGCLPGFVLSKGQCVDSCPAGSFVSPQDNLTCLPCDSSCGTCAGSSTFCLTCTGNQLASAGKCVTTCPPNTFTSASSAGSCPPCHPDCASCSGGSFNQCLSCPPNRPVLANGRCLPTCSQSQFFDKTSSSCQSCDGSCGSCSGPGAGNCLSCSGGSTTTAQVLRAGSCQAVTCQGTPSVVVPGLGVCLSDLVVVDSAGGTGTAPPLPTITGLDRPTSNNAIVRRPLEWWQILLMALGCAFIFVVFLMLWRRRARKQRVKRTAKFAEAKRLDKDPSSWRWRLVRFGEKLFGHQASKRVSAHGGDLDRDDIKLVKLRDVEEARGHRRGDEDGDGDDTDLDGFIDMYDRSTKAPSRSSRAPSTLPSLTDYPTNRNGRGAVNRLSANSLYSQLTGMPRQSAEPRQPIKRDLLGSRFSSSTYGTSSAYSMRSEGGGVEFKTVAGGVVPPVPKLPSTEAERYAMGVRPGLMGSSSSATRGEVDWLEPTVTGGSSNNPFRK